MCQERCLLRCLCGKRCALPCWMPCEPCRRPCPHRCEHARCPGTCGDHLQCALPRGCQERCPKACGRCGARCAGLCGSPCPISLEAFSEANPPYRLADCGCTFGRDALDAYVKGEFRRTKTLKDTHVKCPVCSTPLQTALRYAHEIRALLYSAAELRPPCRVERIDPHELAAIMGALDDSEYYHKNRQHWFQCSNGHPFYVGDCGMPTQTGRCLECRANVGSVRGRLMGRPWMARQLAD